MMNSYRLVRSHYLAKSFSCLYAYVLFGGGISLTSRYVLVLATATNRSVDHNFNLVVVYRTLEIY
jgi:hypothetical protein